MLVSSLPSDEMDLTYSSHLPLLFLVYPFGLTFRCLYQALDRRITVYATKIYDILIVAMRGQFSHRQS